MLSLLATMDHLESLEETHSLADGPLFESLRRQLEELGRKLNRFIASVEARHQTPQPAKTPPVKSHRASDIYYPASSI
jgi:hypothetical protein